MTAAATTATAARRAVLAVLRRGVRSGRLTVVEPDGARHAFGGHGAPEATVVVHDARAWRRILLGGSRGMAEAYRDGLWDAPDLTAVIRVAARNIAGLDALRRRLTPLREPLQRGRAAFRRNTPRRSRRDIGAHYDLGNELFALFLDPTMMYSGAVFTRPRMTLEEASVAKLDMICDKLAISPEDHVLEIGTGWGGFALHAAGTRGCRVTTTTISRAQHDHAVARVRAAGLQDRVTVVMEDYRDLTGRYDKLVSVEMIEAVGWKDFGTFFGVCSDRLAPDGAMLLQAIVMDDRAYAVERASKSFIRTLIFPNGCLPSREVIARCVARDTDLRTVHLEDLTPHYAETLRRWGLSFAAAEGELEALGYDERFRRLWRLYLAYCEAGFAERRIGLVQTVLAKPRWRPTAAAVPAASDAAEAAVVTTR
ncbi:MAG TPA: cyclopropane-fatty-acyl-phospholipid synthase family protein [Baekduia sp.]|uniref:cyclopropane-fatty-acyl-phospholipid synthase family protein n=1 Tax=Baekduia sp. TaxID=2600305 RepID=UPI002D77D0EA|nr:cyclopropane-fatty-acyl-phospholipid synthase family protein [Baekduia sp.]HET6506164.1 cyclopropane-fatty-acyl-phospholipid synthase family protein [Baekduia sp.]